MSTRRILRVPVLLGLLAVTSVALAQGDRQTVLGPGMYVFQTRTTSASCQDDERTGYVSTFLAPIHGVPGSREMRMTLTNSEFWPQWTITVDAAGRVVGDATLAGASGPTAPRNHFSTTRQGERFVGTGQRTYRANGQLCRVEYDALLRRIDQL
ncbi:MAG: hypothetical protein H6719_38765 [Sandaracinaceae bacterium]|nr:hypothetical protein [Sandaracinaceae bacterium]